MKDAVFKDVWSFVVSNDIFSYAMENAPPATNPKTFPVVLFSHGGRWTSFAYTSLIEDLASYGYIVVAIEYTYEAAAVAFPDGRVVSYSQKNVDGMDSPPGTPYDEMVRKAISWTRERVDVMAEDQEFVLDQLSRLNSASDGESPLAGSLDLSRVAAIGHSIGGQASARACQVDDRVRACANLDGGTVDGIFLKYPDALPLSQPFLYMEVPFVPFTPERLNEMNLTPEEWRKQWASSVEKQFQNSTHEGYYVVLQSKSLDHLNAFSDGALLAAADPEARAIAAHNLSLAEAVVLAFLDKYLKNERSTILDSAPHSDPHLKIQEYR